MSIRKKPSIRFKGFTDDWEQRKLGECFSERRESMLNGELISVTINNGIKKFSELDRHDNSNEDKSKYKKVCIGDIAYNSMRMWQGASGYSLYEGIVSPAYTVLSPKIGIDSKCISYLFKRSDMIHIFQINSQGITSDNWNLKYPVFSEISILVAKNIKEQEEIGMFFKYLDNLITLHQLKHDKLKNIKKSMLEKMFPKPGSNIPEIRFKGFTEAWKQQKLSKEVISIETGRSKFSLKENGTYEILGSTSVIGYDDTYDYDGDFLLTARVGANAGELYRHSGKVKISDNTVFIQGDNLDYIFYALLNFNIKRLSFGTGQPLVKASELKEQRILFPQNEKEKVQIGIFFKYLDNLITLHQYKYEKLQNIKKAMLEKMFV